MGFHLENSDKNDTYVRNHQIIEEAYVKLYDETGKHPSQTALAKETGLTRQTIYNHYKDLQLRDVSPKYKTRVNNVLNKLAEKAEEGDVQAIKLYLEVVLDWSPKRQIESTEKKEVIQVQYTSKEDPYKNRKVEETNHEIIDDDYEGNADEADSQ